jgi:hypothetical protein
MSHEFGKKVRTDFITMVNTNTLLSTTENHVIVAVSYEDFKKLVKDVEKSHKLFSRNKEVCRHFNHLSPDVSFLIGKK